MTAELTALAEETLYALTGLPGAADVIPRALVHHVVGDRAAADAVIDLWSRAGHARDHGDGDIELTTVMQPASDSLPRYRAIVRWYADHATKADEATNPDSLRLSRTDVTLKQPYDSAEHARRWFRDHHTQLYEMLVAAHDRGWSELVLQLAEPLWSFFRSIGDHVNELATQDFSLNVVPLLPEDQQPRYRAVCHGRAAFALSSQQSHEEAIAEAERAVEHARQAGDPRIMSAALSIQGRAFQYAKQLVRALACYHEALTISQQLDEPRSLALRCRRLGEVQIELNDLGAAIANLKAAADLMKAAGDMVGYARVMTFLGRAMLKDGQPMAAYVAVLPTLTTLGNSSDFRLADANDVLGEAAELIHPCAEVALSYYATAISKFESGGEPARADQVRTRVLQLSAH